jgi:uncharacterized protein (TIGR03066 family)
MNLRLLLTVAILALTVLAGADAKQVEKIDIAKLSGKWERNEKNGVIVLEIMKDGKAQFNFTRDGKDYTFEGAYKLTGNKIEMTMNLGDKEEKSTRTITKLTNTELVTTDDSGMKREFVRVKAK